MNQERLSRRDFTRREFITLAGLSALIPACSALENMRLVTVTPKSSPVATEPVATPRPSDTPSPTDTSPPEPSVTPDTRALLERYFYPALLTETSQRRAQKGLEDAEYQKRVDLELNAGRVNFVFLGRRDLLTDSIQVMSLNLNKSKINTITIQRDTQAPEITDFLNEDNPYRINQAYAFGGIELTAKILESATGLSSDYVVVTEMQALPRMVKDVFGNQIQVELPWRVPTNVKVYPPGIQTINGEDALRLARERYYGGNRERNVVQQAILKGIFARVKQELTSSPTNAAAFTAKSILFLQKELSSGAMEANFDTGFFFDLAREVVRVIAEEGFDNQSYGFGFPEYAEGYHIQSEKVGYTYWAHSGILRPLNGNPQADNLIADYWAISRNEVKYFLQGDTSGLGFEKEAVCGIAKG